ncbi:nitrile hydratase accessory protein [Metapseudomonas lalkuanensis]|uniref:Nitrile hydratase accessory protein n=1 Tax=Metapseudomonas lalkuanensis TaxID=2604832 RepID=A0A5J6QMX6_9GAMM|nr:nitrile hydratase accessory protein [Pseudomonas lalkuanensis]QEY63032.1 nitrile hydratase accessory protein [Pseudomonas lalkuanensis]
MFTRFEEFAVNSMLGQKDSPPRSHGRLQFTQDWQRSLYGLALALSKAGHFEWEAFRQNLIGSISTWEQLPCDNQPPWDYYERYLEALIKVLQEHSLLDTDELQARLIETKSESTTTDLRNIA